MTTDIIEKKPWILLLTGGLLLVAAHLSFGIGALAFIAPVPLLRYLRVTSGWRPKALFMAVFTTAWGLAVLKIVSEPAMLPVVPVYAIGVATFLGLPYLVWGWIVRRVDDARAVVGFVAMMVISEWAQHAFTPLGSWGAAAYTQHDDLALLQIASVAGMAGVSALVYLVAATVEHAWSHGLARSRRLVTVSGLVLAAALVFGSLRLAISDSTADRTVTAAAVGTDSTIGFSADLPTPAESARTDAGLFERTRRAARAGARLVVWNEAATLVRPDDLPRWLEAARRLAREEKIHLFASYVLLVSADPLSIEIRYALIRPDGLIDHTYAKHHPTPGAPVIAGTGPVPVAETDIGRLSGAICYDYDFPRLALEHASRKVDVVGLPSSDWRGIDPVHTQMAALRAIEGGQSILRSTRFGLSAGIDHHGRIRGWSSSFDDGERILVVKLPAQRVRTLYSVAGDWLVASAGLLLVVFMVQVLLAGLRARLPSRPGDATIRHDDDEAAGSGRPGVAGRLHEAGAGPGGVAG